jgi:hypothetical protein
LLIFIIDINKKGGKFMWSLNWKPAFNQQSYGLFQQRNTGVNNNNNTQTSTQTTTIQSPIPQYNSTNLANTNNHRMAKKYGSTVVFPVLLSNHGQVIKSLQDKIAYIFMTPNGFYKQNNPHATISALVANEETQQAYAVKEKSIKHQLVDDIIYSFLSKKPQAQVNDLCFMNDGTVALEYKCIASNGYNIGDTVQALNTQAKAEGKVKQNLNHRNNLAVILGHIKVVPNANQRTLLEKVQTDFLPGYKGKSIPVNTADKIVFSQVTLDPAHSKVVKKY